jgi:5-methyltetrahydropteroyltriglutamate--homocysteine methyltransferase
LPAIGAAIKDKKIVIGVIDYHTLQVERPDQVREALKHVPPERLIISSDLRDGPRGHATYKMVAMVLGTNLVRKELGLSEAECLAADPRYSLAAARTLPDRD